MNEQELRHRMKELAEEGFPEPVDLWPRLRAQVEASSRLTGLRQWIRQPLAWGLAALLIALGVGASVYAGGLWEAFILAREPMRRSLATPLGLQQEHDGYRITLEWAYADWNAILIGYRIQGPSEPPQRLEIPEIRLQDETGWIFPLEAGEGLVGASELLGLALPPGERAFVTAFDMWGHEPLSNSLRLQLTLRLIVMEPPPGGGPSNSQREIGPFVFAFTVPVHPGYAISTPRSVTANGITVTLERLIAAPSGTRARLCITPLDPQRSWSPILSLILNSRLRYAGGIRRDGEACFQASFLVGSTDPHLPEGSLQVLELIGWDPSGQREPVRLPGPWRLPLTQR